MPSSVRGPKTLFEWIEPDYYRRSRWLRRWVRLLGWAALLAGAGVVAATIWGRLPSFYEAGPLTSAHSMFNERCESCHTTAFATAVRLRPDAGAVHSVSDEACMKCHEGGPHHAEQQVQVPACATCHHEHRGQAALMTVPDSDCVACHGDLHLKDGSPPPVGNVHRFATDHPPFRVPVKDPGHIHFNHAAHLSLPPDTLRGRARELLPLLSESKCAFCHQLDADRRYMKPIDYQKHCAECHPLSVQLVGRWKDNEKARQAAEEFSKVPAPHVAALEVRAALRDRLAELARDHPAVVKDNDLEPPDRPIPGQPADTPPSGDVRGWMDFQLHSMEHVLFDGGDSCRRCHVEAPGSRTPDQPGALPRYEPSDIPRRWLHNSVFDHGSHQMLDCKECHAQATTSTQATDVMLPEIQTCQRCHNPSVGVRSNCIDCHRYHEHTTKEGWKGDFTIDEALRPSQERHR
jgi:hypothetical protein